MLDSLSHFDMAAQTVRPVWVTVYLPMFMDAGVYKSKVTIIDNNGDKVRLPFEVEVVDMKYRESGYDSDFVGSFNCDNEFCNKLWQKAQRTLYVNMRDTYMDCPDRERGQWWGDVVIELGQVPYVFDNRAHKLTQKAIAELMAHQREDGTIYSPIPGSFMQELPCQMLAAVGEYGFYWTSTSKTSGSTWHRLVFYKSGGIHTSCNVWGNPQYGSYAHPIRPVCP